MSMGGGESNSRSKSRDLTPREYVAERPFIADFGRTYQGGTPYGGPLSAPLSGQEQTTLSGLSGMRNPFGQDASREELLGTIQGKSPLFQNALQEAINAGMIDISRFAEDENLANRALFNRAGQTLSESSPFAMAQARSNQGVLDAVAKLSSDIRLPAMLQERQNQLAATGMLTQQEDAGLARQLQILEAEGLPRMIQEQGISRGLELYKEQQARILAARSMLAQLTSPNLGQKASSESMNWNFCWVAEELWGANDTKTHSARLYATTHTSEFLTAYRQHGRAWAEEISNNPALRPLVEPTWLAMAALGSLMLAGV